MPQFMGLDYVTDGDIVIAIDDDSLDAETSAFRYIQFGGTAWRWRFRIPMEADDEMSLGMFVLAQGRAPFDMPFPAHDALQASGNLVLSAAVTPGDNAVTMRSTGGAVALKLGTPLRYGDRVYAVDGPHAVINPTSVSLMPARVRSGEHQHARDGRRSDGAGQEPRRGGGPWARGRLRQGRVRCGGSAAVILLPADIRAALESGRAVVAQVVEMTDSRAGVVDMLLTDSQIPITVEGKTYMPRVGTVALIRDSIRLPVGRSDFKREAASFAVTGNVTLPVPTKVVIGFAILLEAGANIMASTRFVQFTGDDDGSTELEDEGPYRTVLSWTGDIAKTREANKFILDPDEQEIRSVALGKARDTSTDHTALNRVVRWGGQSRLESGGSLQRERRRFERGD